jgi:cephalosporin hydroxylase
MVNNIENISNMNSDTAVIELRKQMYTAIVKYKYSYNFEWLGRPIIQLPQDIIAIQELIWKTKPDLIIETGIAHGGSLILSASILELLAGNGEVIGIDIDIRKHNREAIMKHPLYQHNRIRLIEGSSTDAAVVNQLYEIARNKKNVMIILDSDHTHEHVRKELELYSPMVTKDNYLIVFDTLINDLPDDMYPDRNWGIGNNPKTAVAEFINNNMRFCIDYDFEAKFLFTSAPGGYLRCIKEY